jgi:CHAD domain-containing protein
LTAGATAAQAFVANVAAAAEQISANAPGLLKSRNPEYLHQLRVGIRRMRSTLRAFRALARRRRSSAFDTELRSTLRILGQARDWDAFSASDLPASLRQAARHPRARSLRKVRAAVHRKRFQSLPARVLRWAKTNPWRGSADPNELIGSFGARALKRLHSELSRCADEIDWTDGERRHRVRIRAKRLRYGLDCFAWGFAPASVERFAHRLHALQEVLGELNDCRVQRSLLRQLASHEHSQPAARAGSRLASRERRLIGKAVEAWSKLEKHPQHWRREAVRARG